MSELNKYSIWGQTIPFNSDKSKLDDMKIKKIKNEQKQQLKSILAISRIGGNIYFDRQADVDTLTYLRCIKPGIVESTYTDVPSIVHYPAEGSNIGVVVIPGGGFAMSDDPASEGEETSKIARRLNERGINAFVLGYRVNPYKFPVPFYDLQRAIKYIKVNASKFGIDPEKIGLVGFSAGGYTVGAFLNIFRGKDNLPEEYARDMIDNTDDSVKCAGMFYPAVSVKKNLGVLFAAADNEIIKNRKVRKEQIEKYELADHINSVDVPQFIAQGTKDLLVDYRQAKNYAESVKKHGGNSTYVEVPGANHIFTNKEEYAYAFDMFMDWVLDNMK